MIRKEKKPLSFLCRTVIYAAIRPGTAGGHFRIVGESYWDETTYHEDKAKRFAENKLKLDQTIPATRRSDFQICELIKSIDLDFFITSNWNDPNWHRIRDPGELNNCVRSSEIHNKWRNWGSKQGTMNPEPKLLQQHRWGQHWLHVDHTSTHRFSAYFFASLSGLWRWGLPVSLFFQMRNST